MSDLFGVEEKSAIDEWKDMPEFVQEEQRPFSQVIVRFRNQEDLDAFSAAIGQKLTKKTKSIWFPAIVRGLTAGLRWRDEP